MKSVSRWAEFDPPLLEFTSPSFDLSILSFLVSHRILPCVTSKKRDMISRPSQAFPAGIPVLSPPLLITEVLHFLGA
jgi:hypothetical protein